MAYITNTLADRIISQWNQDKVKKQLKNEHVGGQYVRSTCWQETRQLHNTGETQPGTRKERGRTWGHWGVSTAHAVELLGLQVQDGQHYRHIYLAPFLETSEVTSKKYKGDTFIIVLQTQKKAISKSRFC